MYTRIDEANQPIGLPASFPPEEDGYDWYPMIMPPPRQSEAQKMVWGKIGGRVVGSWEGSEDPLDRPATADEIKLNQEKYEYAPIEVFGVILDCDSRSEKLMQGSIETWDGRPVEPGWFEDLEVDGVNIRVLYWKSADNTKHPLVKLQLISVFEQMKLNRAIRAQKLWAKAQYFKECGCTLREVLNMSGWLA